MTIDGAPRSMLPGATTDDQVASGPGFELAAAPDDRAAFGAPLAPWMALVDTVVACRADDHLLDRWGVALVAGDVDEVDRLVRQSRTATVARWQQMCDDEPLLG